MTRSGSSKKKQSPASGKSRKTTTGKKAAPGKKTPGGAAPTEKKTNPRSKKPSRRPVSSQAAKKASKADETRLNKYLANAGIASRREADQLIETGLVEVNGETITSMGYKVKPGDTVKFNGSAVNPERKVYYLMNKPKGFITTTDDPKARKTVMELIASAGKERIYPVGRLDRKTTGVLLFTNDGNLAKKLTHPSHGARKIYQVTLDKNLEKSDFHKIQEGLNLEDGPIKVDELAYVEGKSRKNIGVILHSGRNRIVRRIFEHLGYEVTQLDRVSFAGLTKKNLSRGQWRKLSPQELQFLQKSGAG